MMKKNKKEFGKLVVFLLLIILVTVSAAQAISYQTIRRFPPKRPLSLDDFFFVWEDEFNSYEYIDPDLSYNHVVSDGLAYMEHTYPVWSDPDWEYMKPITINNAGSALTDYAVYIDVEMESGKMQDDYDDLRFKHENNPNIWLNYWIEEYDSSSAHVWVKIPSIPSGQSKMYMFYGNPGASGQSNFYNVFEWTEKWANDEQISYNEGKNKYRAEDPDVSYGSNKFLVSWEEGEYPKIPWTFYWKHNIKGKIYNPDGTVAVDEFTIRTGSGTQWHHENPQAAYGGGKFLVTWQHYYTSDNPQSANIIARWVTPSGGVGDQWVVCEEDYAQCNPEIVFDSVNSRFFIVWEDARQSYNNYNIYGKLYDTSGNQVGSEKNICTDSGNQCEPWVAFDPINEQYMVVWEEGVTANNGPFDIYVGLFDENLNCLGPGSGNEPLKIADGDEDTDYNFPCVCFCEETERYLVTWNDGDISDGDYKGNVWGRIFDSSGNTVKNNWKIKEGNYVRTDIVPYLETCWLVSFDGGGKIWGKFVDSDGTAYTGDIQLSASPGAWADWASMMVGDEKIFVAWEDTRIQKPYPWDGNSNIFGNIWQLNIPSSDDVTITIGSEVQMVLEARITSVVISPGNLEAWEDFWETDYPNGGDITFDVLDEDGTTVLIEGITNGQSLHSLNPDYTAIRLRADFERSNPSNTPELENWSVRYLGVDDDPPVTHVKRIDGTQGRPPWYIDDLIIVWLEAEDMPPEYHSGVDYTLFKVNDGEEQVYNEDTGIQLVVPEPELWAIWELKFWSVDKKGNVEDPPKERTIQTDAQDPDVYITKPADEAHVTVPFLVTVDATDNYDIENVVFDISPFGERPGLPYNDTSYPWEWLCEEEDGMGQAVAHILVKAYDASGREDYHDIEIWVDNWEVTIENTNCFIIAQGSGTVSNTFPIVLFKDITWHYTEGYCGTLGEQGARAVDGEHWGIARKFIGISTNNRIIGYAKYVKASNMPLQGVNVENYLDMENYGTISGNVNVEINNIQTGQGNMYVYFGKQGATQNTDFGAPTDGNEATTTYNNIQNELSNINNDQVEPMVALFDLINRQYTVVWDETKETTDNTKTWIGLFDYDLNLMEPPTQLTDDNMNYDRFVAVWDTILDDTNVEEIRIEIKIWDSADTADQVDYQLIESLEQLFGPENIRVYWDDYLNREVIQVTLIYTPPVRNIFRTRISTSPSILSFLQFFLVRK